MKNIIENELQSKKDMKEEILKLFKEFPFKSYLSFKPLIEFWEKDLNHENEYRSHLVKEALEKVYQIPELNKPIEDLSLIEKYKDVIDLLMTIIYPPTQWDKMIASSVVPFSFNFFYRTPSFEKILPRSGIFSVENFGMDPKAVFIDKVINAYLLILEQHYNVKTDFKDPMVMAIRNKSTLLYNYFQLNVDTSFTKSICIGELPKLNEEDIKKLLKDAYNIKLWMKLLPPENFVFHGFVTFMAYDVTEQEVISEIKYDLLEKASFMSIERFHEIENKVRSLFMLPDLKLGLAALPDDWSSNYRGWKIGDSFVLNDLCELECMDYDNSIYGKVVKDNKYVLIEDLENYESTGKVEKEILKQGIRNILIAPLVYNDKVIGAFELGSPNPGDINSLNSKKIKSILPLFATAVKRSAEEFENQIQKIIKEKCTAIHPSVEWRFRHAAANLISNKSSNKLAEMEPIVFENVYPLYGLSDIRNSSEYRNEAVRGDMIEHLNLAKSVLQSANAVKKLPLFDEMIYRIDKHINRVDKSLSSGDEVSILEFLQNEIEPVFNHIKNYDSSLNDLIRNYIKILDPQRKTLYTKRSEYEESVSLINETISAYLDECDEEAQKMFPHYFEKYKTDGVEHGIYIGESLIENSRFNQIYLKNLRLWQLMAMCGVINKLNELPAKLKIPLEASHLILVQNTPLSIRFRFDEKKFDVDGTYNLRYEIMKKRIDKALIKGTNERLTQPGKIAVVYSNVREAKEYKRYIEFLGSIGNTECKLEEFDLEDLQGMAGLRALRFTVNLDSKVFQKKMNGEEIRGTVTELEKLLN